MDYLVATGVAGVLSYLGIFFVFYWTWLKTRWTLIKGYYSPLAILAAGSLAAAAPAAYLAQGMFLFDVLPIFFPFLLIIAFTVQEFFSTDRPTAQ